jgi:hypothetical protein
VSEEIYNTTVALSHAELCALIKWHSAQARTVGRKLGKVQMEMMAERFPASGKTLKVLHQEAKRQIDFHIGRAKGLLSLLPDAKGGAK